MSLDHEALGYWYLRLNGYLTTVNFIVHPDQGRNQETDADILGVRFPYRAENLHQPMKDAPAMIGHAGQIQVVIAEVKTGRCALNGPWTKPERQNMNRILHAIGPIQSKHVPEAAKNLYEHGYFDHKNISVRLLCLGREASEEITASYPAVPQITWRKVTDFIYERFSKYRRQKVSHQQWDAGGHQLWDAFESCRDAEEYAEEILRIMQ